MKALKFIGKSLLALLLVMLIFWTIILGILRTRAGQNLIFKRLVAYVEDRTQTRIKAQNIHFSFPIKFRIEKMKLYRKKVLLLEVESARAECSFIRLLEGRFVFTVLEADTVRIVDFPEADPNEALSKNPTFTDFDRIRFPFYLKIANFRIGDISLDPRLTEKLPVPKEMRSFFDTASFNLEGMIGHNPFKAGIESELLVTVIDEIESRSPISLSAELQNHRLSLFFESDRLPAPFGAPLPFILEGDLKIHAEGSTKDWESLFTDPSDRRLAINGQIAFSPKLFSKETRLPLINDGPITLSSDFTVHSPRSFSFLDLRLNSPYLAMKGSFSLDEGHIISEENFTGEFHGFERQKNSPRQFLEGQFLFDAAISGPISDPGLRLSVKSPRISIYDRSFTNLRVDLKAAGKEEGPDGSFVLKMNGSESPWEIESDFYLRNAEELRLDRLQINALRSHLRGSLTYFIPDLLFEGDINASSDNVEEISRFFGVAASGGADVHAILTAPRNEEDRLAQTGKLTFTGKGLNTRDLRAKDLRIDSNFARIGEGFSVFRVEGRAEGEEIDSKGYSVFDFLAQGTMQVDFKEEKIESCSVEWEANKIQASGGALRTAKGSIQLQNASEQSRVGTVRIAFEELAIPEIAAEQVTFETTFSGETGDRPFLFSLRQQEKDGLIVRAEGNWNSLRAGFEGTIANLEGTWKAFPLSLKHPMQFSFAPDEVTVKDIVVFLGNAELRADFFKQQQKFRASVRTNPFSADLLRSFVPSFPITGDLEFNAEFTGNLDSPLGKIEIDLQNVRLPEQIFSTPPTIDGKIRLSLDDRGMQIDSELHGIDRTPLIIAGNLPVSIGFAPFSIDTKNDLPFELKIDAEGDLDPYLHLFSPEATNLSGHLRIALKLSGKMNAPEVYGTIDLENASYESSGTGAIFPKIQARLKGEGNRLDLTYFLAEDNKSGSIDATGSISLDPGNLFPFEFLIRPSKIFIVNSDYASLSGTGPLKLSGNIRRAKLSGRLIVDEATVRLEESLPTEIKSVDIRYINLPEEMNRATYKGHKESESSIELDVNVELPGRIYIGGHHLTSEWKGAVTLTGTPEDPLVNGDLEVIKGEYDFNGKIFELTRGNIHFAGLFSKKTTLYIVASKEISNLSPGYQNANIFSDTRSAKGFDRLRTDIIVKGQVNKPSISFRSEPPLSQREILSYILFNRGISDITTDQGDQLSQSFISLNSGDDKGKTTDFLSRLRNNIGIDRLDFTSGSDRSNDYSLQVGKYITENIFVSINKSINAAVNRIAVEIDLQKNFKAQAEVGDDSQVRTSIKWKKDY